jgi:hypothetical protein
VDERTARAARRLDQVAKGIEIGVAFLVGLLIAFGIALYFLFLLLERMTADSPA